MAGRSVIESHPQREAIESAILAGVQGKVIARQYGVSEAAISRHKNSRMALTDDELEPDGLTEAGSADALVRLVELAASPRRARQMADRSGNPTMKARAQASELAVLDRLFNRLGITDLTLVYWSAMASDLYSVVVNLTAARPDIRADVLALMSKYKSLTDLDLPESPRGVTP